MAVSPLSLLASVQQNRSGIFSTWNQDQDIHYAGEDSGGGSIAKHDAFRGAAAKRINDLDERVSRSVLTLQLIMYKSEACILSSLRPPFLAIKRNPPSPSASSPPDLSNTSPPGQETGADLSFDNHKQRR